MKYTVIRFKDLKTCLKQLEPFIRDGEHLQTGKPFKKFGGMRSREILANWLLCVAINSNESVDRLTFCSDPLGGDGLICENITKKTWKTEHILVPRTTDKVQNVEALILKAIEKKQQKGGSAYASGKTLIVFLNASGEQWHPNKVARNLPTVLDFESIWVVGLQSVIPDEEYIYNIVNLNLGGNSPVWQIHIEKDFDSWQVNQIQ